MAAHPDQASTRPHNARLETLGHDDERNSSRDHTPIQFIGDNLQFISDSFATIDDLLQRYAALHKAAVAGNALDVEARTVAEAVEGRRARISS